MARLLWALAVLLAQSSLAAGQVPQLPTNDYPTVARADYVFACMIADIRAGDIDAGVLWGPIAGYFAGRDGEKLTLVPLLKEMGEPRLAYRITFGVRNLEDDWKHQLNAIIAKRQGDIDAILLGYGVPLIDDNAQLVSAPRR